MVKSGNPVSVMFMAEVSMAMRPGPCPDVLQLLVGVVLGQCSWMLGEKHGEADSVLIWAERLGSVQLAAACSLITENSAKESGVQAEQQRVLQGESCGQSRLLQRVEGVLLPPPLIARVAAMKLGCTTAKDRSSFSAKRRMLQRSERSGADEVESVRWS
ncbi:hypothetical protein F7725_023910 [Dissostichus mawsoni]|uniref:Uncharacterized protein n=1 Tax=Dissostichus mawsoni TaxID=36200 RepID=A0A7J5Y0R9_DISMA|nr:hypothetical protein F7725_023910 [Dissostichus mawsoni]